MKKIFLLPAILLLSASLDAQVVTTEKREVSKQVQDKPLTIKTTAENRMQKKATTSPATPQPAALKNLDIVFTNLTVTATRVNADTFKLTINYTIINVDTVAVSLADISLQGLLGLDPNPSNVIFKPACGSTVGLRRDVLNPGASTSGTYYCFNQKLSLSERYVYWIGLNAPAGFKVVDPNKSQRKVFVTI